MRSQSSSKRFTPAGEVKYAELTLEPPFITAAKKVRVSGKKGEGNRYERKAQAYLQESLGIQYVPGPWFRFRSYASDKWRFCQPDGLLIDIPTGRITIVEIKLKHTAVAWWQVRQLYEPVLQSLFPSALWSFAACEVVRWYDPDTPFPEALRLSPTIESIKPGQFGLHIWNDRGQARRQHGQQHSRSPNKG